MKMDIVTKNHPAAQHAIQRWGELKTIRARYEPDWEDLARLIRPQRGGFAQDNRAATRTMHKPLSSEPIMAHNAFAAGIYSSLTNPANRWGSLETPDVELNAWKPMAEWLDLATRRVLNSFSPAVSGFYAATYQAYADLAAFGNAAHYDQPDTAQRKFIDVTVSLAEVVVDIDAHGRVAEVVRKFQLKARTAVREFGRDALPPAVIKAADTGTSDDFTFYQHVLPNDDFVAGRIGPRGKRFLSVVACDAEATLVRQSGFDDMPFYYPRWDVDSGAIYGTGPGFIALPSTRAVHLMDDATMRAAQFAADPTKLAPDRNAIPLNGTFRPGGIVYGATDIRGNPLVRNMDHTPSIGLTDAEKAKKIEAVREAFHYALMSLAGRTGITSEEVRIMEEARLRNWAPHADRIMEEYAAAKFERRFRLLWRMGQIPPPPPEAAGMPMGVRYQSTATMAMKVREAGQIRQFLSDLAPMAQLDPRFVDRLDPDGIAEALHDASPGLPTSILRSREEADKLAQQRAEAQQQAQQMQMLQGAASAASDLGVTMGAGGAGA